MNKHTEHGSYAYGYDDLYRLMNVQNPTLDDESFTYDPVGNRETSSGVTWTYNENDELLDSDSESYEYDDNGNMVKKTIGTDVTNYFYNVEDRLVRVEDGTGTFIAEYYYDPFDRRLWKDVGGARTYFLYSDEGLVGEYDSSGSEIRAYGYAPGSTWTTDPLFIKEGGEYFFYHNDHLGTPQKVTAINGSVVWEAKYTSFGEAIIEPSSTITNNLRFPGQYYDQETGLHYNYYRYYGSDIGRYFKVDPTHFMHAEIEEISFMLGFTDLPQEFNSYAYSLNNPTNDIDPLGLRVLNPDNYQISNAVLNSLRAFNLYIGCGFDIVITSGYRPWDSGYHSLNLAADIYVPGQDHLTTANQAIRSGLFCGIGWYQEGWSDPEIP